MSNDNFKKVKMVLWLILFANFGVAALKIIIGRAINSVSMVADGFHSLTDGSSNIVGLIGIQLAARPKDEDHPYGHGKFETLAGLFIAGMLFFIGGKVALGALERFRNPVLPAISIESLLALLATLIVNILVCFYEYRKGKQLNSMILVSDSLHTRSDIFISLGVLVTLAGIKLGLPPVIDPLVSLVVSGFILHASYEIFRDNCNVLLDKAVVDSEKIKKIALSFDQVIDTHNIRSRGSENDLHIDMHIITAPDLSVEKSHALIHKIEDKLRKEINNNIQVIVHLEPYKPTVKPTAE